MSTEKFINYLVATAVAIIIFAIVITAVMQGPADKAFSQIITVGPEWNDDSWSCTSDADFMVHSTLRGIDDSPQLRITIPEVGTQSLLTLDPEKMETFSIGASGGSTLTMTRTGTITGFITLQTTSDATASCSNHPAL